MSEQNKKRERNANFSREETDKVISLVEDFIHVLENKRSDAETWQEKEKAWKTIAAEFNSSGVGVFRDAKHLKSKYEAIKRDIRKKTSFTCTEENKTSGGVNERPSLTPVEQKVRRILLSVEGSESNDSDQLDVTANGKPKEAIVLADSYVQPASLIEHIKDSNTKDYSKELTFDILENTSQKRRLQHANDPVPGTSKQVDQEIAEILQKKWAELKEESSQKPDLSKPEVKGLFVKLALGKLETVELRKKIIAEELQEKLLKKQMMVAELRHKQEMYKLEKEEMMLKIEILKHELESKTKS